VVVDLLGRAAAAPVEGGQRLVTVLERPPEPVETLDDVRVAGVKVR
jgi:hypothetical protein